MTKKEKYEVTEEQYKKLQFIENVSEEDKQKGRLETIKGNERRIKHLERFVEHKRQQVKTGISVETHLNYKDVKPIFMIENEIEEIESQIELLKDATKIIKEEYEKNGNKD